MADDLSTEDLLRMIGREVQGIRHETKRTANSVGFLAFITALNVLVACLWVFGLIEVSFTPG